jgi:hypothetical protein
MFSNQMLAAFVVKYGYSSLACSLFSNQQAGEKTERKGEMARGG